jgi:hypothetical protein
MRQGISVEYVRYLTGRSKSVAARQFRVFVGSTVVCARLYRTDLFRALMIRPARCETYRPS